MAKKVFFTDEEVAKLPTKREPQKRVFTDAEVNSGKDLGFEAEDDSYLGEDVIKGIATAGEYLDRYTGSPTRAAISAALEGKNPISAGASAVGEPTSETPSGKDIARQVGVSDDVIVEDAPVIGDITKSGLVGFGIDLAADPVALFSGAIKVAGKAARSIKPIRIALKTRASKQAFKAMAQMSTNSKLKEVFNKTMPQIVGQHLVDADLAKYLNKPEKLLEAIRGKETASYTSKKIGSKVVDFPVKDYSGGIISDISRETDDILKQVASKVDDVDVSDVVDRVSQRNIRLRIDPESAEAFSAQDIARYDKKIKEFLKPLGGKADKRSVVELQELKRNIGKKIQSKEFFAPQDKKMIAEKMAMMDIYHELKRTIEGALDGVPVQFAGEVADAGALVGLNNQKVTSLMDVTSLLENVPASELKKPSTAQAITNLLTSGAVGLGVGAMTNSTTAGLVAGGAYGATKFGEQIAKKIPGAEASAISNFLKPGALPKKTLIPTGVRQLRHLDEDNGREPQSIAEDLARTPIPRDSSRILENKDFIKAKALEQAPEIYDQLSDVLDNDPEAISEILPAITRAAPHLFERDAYDRIDGVIIDPMMREKAAKDTMNRQDISNMDKIEIINELNKTGQFDGM